MFFVMTSAWMVVVSESWHKIHTGVISGVVEITYQFCVTNFVAHYSERVACIQMIIIKVFRNNPCYLFKLFFQNNK